METKIPIKIALPEEELPQPLGGYQNLRWVRSGRKRSTLVGMTPKSKEELSIKIIRASSLEELDTCESTLKSLQSLDHPNISSLYDILTSSNEQPYLVYYGTDLDEISLSEELREKQFSTAEAFNIFYGIAHALFSAKTRLNLYHGKVSPSNVIKFKGSYKITNFHTLQKSLNTQADYSPDSLKSLEYLAPEQRDTEQNESHSGIDNFACDVFSLGMLGLELFGKDTHVLRIMSPKTKVYEEEQDTLIKNLKEDVDFELGNLIGSMVSFDPWNRPCVEKVTETLSGLLDKFSDEDILLRKNEIDKAYKLVTEGEASYENSDYGNALSAFQKFLSTLQRFNGKPSDLAHAYGKIGIIQFALGIFEESYKNLKLNLEISRRLYGSYHADIGDALINISRINLILQKFEEALRSAEEAIAVYKGSFGAYSEEEAQVWILIGHIHKAKKSYKMAQDAIIKGLDILKVRKQDETPEIADSLELLGLISCELKDIGKALFYHQSALSIRIKTLSSNHPRIANSYRSLGYTYLLMDDSNKGISLYEMALKILKINYGKDHPEVHVLQIEIGQEYIKAGQTKKAIEVLEFAESEIGQQILKSNPRTAHKLFSGLANAYKAAGKGKKAEVYFLKANKAFEETM